MCGVSSGAPSSTSQAEITNGGRGPSPRGGRGRERSLPAPPRGCLRRGSFGCQTGPSEGTTALLGPRLLVPPCASVYPHHSWRRGVSSVLQCFPFLYSRWKRSCFLWWLNSLLLNAFMPGEKERNSKLRRKMDFRSGMQAVSVLAAGGSSPSSTILTVSWAAIGSNGERQLPSQSDSRPARAPKRRGKILVAAAVFSASATVTKKGAKMLFQSSFPFAARLA